MEILLSECYGFCGGVKRAVQLAFDTAEKETQVKIIGELVHNASVVEELSSLGVEQISPRDAIENSVVITRSHGIEKQEKEKLIATGNTVVDTTCPHVIKIQKIVEEATEENVPVILVGKKDHPEILAIKSYGKENVFVVSHEDEINSLNFDQFSKIVVVSQTTNPINLLNRVEVRLKEVFTGEILLYNTICKATKDRQEACRVLAKTVDCMLVIGGKNSANTKKLVEIASEYCEHVFHIQTINELDLRPLKKFNKIGITAGASTPDSVIKEAVSRMENLNRDEMNNEMMEAIENSFTRVRRGEIVEGEVLYVTDNEVMVNINYRADGIISKEELSNDPAVKPSDLFEQGDQIQVFIMKMDDGDGNVVLSYKRVENMKVWDEMEEKFNNKELVTANVKSVVKGGLTCEVEGLNGFIPASHASVRFQRDLSRFVGEEMLCEIIDFDKSRRKFVLSRKNVEAKEIEEKRSEVYGNINEGDLIDGTVQRLTNFGAFVDIGGVDGLIHISELSWNRVKHPSDVVSPGQEVKVQVLKVDEENNRIALGLKQTTQKPWEVFTDSIKVGDVVKGKVVNLLDFGAFVRLESGVDGLLHVSQISKEHVEKPADKLEMGQEIEVKVTDINNEDKKISLSMKALLEDDEPAAKEEKEVVAEAKPKREPKPKKEKRPVEPVEAEDDGFSMTIGDLINLKDFDSNEE
ncbi:bifunctional 4-hydroxy-3-methylbut-2-enyl diphosphate reductase/30S ribosomal protein S1 [Peptoniphilus sp. KCTC 25270]|uniref:bifunctional 4-hydroxy-3-methylbut-2-enyl diphosphate reductase/30S ribosomal protein S1 n=1 Tax=Peptoniphilus sp. KCTC 25270 TaxID=2897414 RepID=UPI001E55F360|nr:bifunctional 4-hydroxy-3-methylbut-2-enyl diphosphate reductase/30S ribosomal protein S1 [Peptoniphilus sp. KCTC 25270]MCD1147132.1 bifunctional 4-hydroxy-3-methylbut-2-enyl diphosphate reductase/30S ribosomal protein S1 [Peptoniphilus sp. KCTC 25270]